jgi:hypothetical protein
MQREHLDTARIMGFSGKDATDYAQLMSSEFPNEQARVDAIQQRFPDIGMTEMQRLQAENIRLNMAATRQGMHLRGFQIRDLQRLEDNRVRIESIAQELGQDPRLFMREFQVDVAIADSHNKDGRIRNALDLFGLYAAEDTWATAAAGELDTTRERILATVRPLNEQYRNAALGQYQGGLTPDELVAQLSTSGQLTDQANARLTRRWYESEGIPLTTSTDDLSDEKREELTNWVTAGLNEEVRVLREAYRMAYRHGAVDTNLFRGVEAAEFPAARAAGAVGPPEPPAGDRAVDPRAERLLRGIEAATSWIQRLMISRGFQGAGGG